MRFGSEQRLRSPIVSGQATSEFGRLAPKFPSQTTPAEQLQVKSEAPTAAHCQSRMHEEQLLAHVS